MGQNTKRNVIMPKLNVGDKVKIVNVKNCEFGCNPSMLKLDGKITVITNIVDICQYKVKADGSLYSWSANCLEPVDCKCKFILKNE